MVTDVDMYMGVTTAGVRGADGARRPTAMALTLKVAYFFVERAVRDTAVGTVRLHCTHRVPLTLPIAPVFCFPRRTG